MPEPLQDLLRYAAESNPEALTCDGFDDAIIGVVERCAFPPVVLYDADKILLILMQRDGMTYDEAQEYFEFNIIGAYVGEGTPMYLVAKRDSE